MGFSLYFLFHLFAPPHNRWLKCCAHTEPSDRPNHSNNFAAIFAFGFVSFRLIRYKCTHIVCMYEVIYTSVYYFTFGLWTIFMLPTFTATCFPMWNGIKFDTTINRQCFENIKFECLSIYMWLDGPFQLNVAACCALKPHKMSNLIFDSGLFPHRCEYFSLGKNYA